MAQGDYTGYGTYLSRTQRSSDYIITTLPGGSVNPTSGLRGYGGDPFAPPEITTDQFILMEGMTGFAYQVDLQLLHRIPNFPPTDLQVGFGPFPYNESGSWLCEVWNADLSVVLFRQKVNWTWAMQTLDAFHLSRTMWTYTESIDTQVVDGNAVSGSGAEQYLDNDWTSESNTQHGLLGDFRPTFWQGYFRSAPYRMWLPQDAVIKMTYDQQTMAQRQASVGYPVGLYWGGDKAFDTPGQSEMYVNTILYETNAPSLTSPSLQNLYRGFGNNFPHSFGEEVFNGYFASPLVRPQADRIGAVMLAANIPGVASADHSGDGLRAAFTLYDRSFFTPLETVGQLPDQTASASIGEAPTGELIIMARDIHSGTWNLYHSTDGGRSWTFVASPWDNSYEMASFILARSGALYTVAFLRETGHTWFSFSVDGGATWTDPVLAFGPTPFGVAPPVATTGPQLVEYSTGEIRLVLHNGPQVRSLDTGQTWKSI